MASVNRVILVGNLGRDPEVRYMPSGDAIANIAVATSYKPKDKEPITEWHRVSFFGRLAEIAGQFLTKGSSVYIEGRLQTRKYQDKDGIEKYSTEIIAESMQMLDKRGDADSQQQQQPAPRQQASQAAPAPRPAPKPAPKFDDLDTDIPFVYSNTCENPVAKSSQLMRSKLNRGNELEY